MGPVNNRGHVLTIYEERTNSIRGSKYSIKREYRNVMLSSRIYFEQFVNFFAALLITIVMVLVIVTVGRLATTVVYLVRGGGVIVTLSVTKIRHVLF
jgi:hypothetical protein